MIASLMMIYDESVIDDRCVVIVFVMYDFFCFVCLFVFFAIA